MCDSSPLSHVSHLRRRKSHCFCCVGGKLSANQAVSSNQSTFLQTTHFTWFLLCGPGGQRQYDLFIRRPNRKLISIKAFPLNSNHLEEQTIAGGLQSAASFQIASPQTLFNNSNCFLGLKCTQSFLVMVKCERADTHPKMQKRKEHHEESKRHPKNKPNTLQLSGTSSLCLSNTSVPAAALTFLPPLHSNAPLNAAILAPVGPMMELWSPPGHIRTARPVMKLWIFHCSPDSNGLFAVHPVSADLFRTGDVETSPPNKNISLIFSPALFQLDCVFQAASTGVRGTFCLMRK